MSECLFGGRPYAVMKVEGACEQVPVEREAVCNYECRGYVSKCLAVRREAGNDLWRLA